MIQVCVEMVTPDTRKLTIDFMCHVMMAIITWHFNPNPLSFHNPNQVLFVTEPNKTWTTVYSHHKKWHEYYEAACESSANPGLLSRHDLVTAQRFVDTSNHPNLFPLETLWLNNNVTQLPPLSPTDKTDNSFTTWTYMCSFGALKQPMLLFLSIQWWDWTN